VIGAQMAISIGFVHVVMFGTHLTLWGIVHLVKEIGSTLNAPDPDIPEAVVLLVNMKIGI